jgi:hypothetical protein
MSAARYITVISAIFSLFSPLRGQTEKQLLPSDQKQMTVVTEPVTLRKGFFRTGSAVGYRVADRYFTNEGDKEYYTNSTWGSKAAYNLIIQYGISDRLELYLATEYMKTVSSTKSTELVAGTNTTREVVSKKKGIGLGDSYINLRYQIVPEKKYRFSLTASAGATLPTGQKNPTNIRSANQFDLPVGDGTYALNLGLHSRTIIYPYSFALYLNYTKNFEGSKLMNATDNTESRFRFGNYFEAGASSNLHMNEWIVFSNEINYYNEGEGYVSGIMNAEIKGSWALSYEPGLVFQVKRFRFGESVQIPLKGKNVPADALYQLLIQYVF